MSFKFQVVDILLGSLLAGVGTYVLSAVVASYLAVALGAFFAAMFYFSRNPWGSPDGAAYNDRIDDLYDQFLP
jgi:archaellum biogenesis protein FlaJ (TadC family)